MNSRWPRSGLYAITPDDNDTARLLESTRQVLAGGAVWLQYRNKSANDALRHLQAFALRALCRDHNVALIINDDWRLAAAVGADGVHLGEHDGALADARAALGPDALIGISCYDSLARAHDAARLGADYVALRPCYLSPTNPNPPPAPLPLPRHPPPLWLTTAPIGGILASNAKRLIDAGADLVAVITGVYGAADPTAEARSITRLFDLPENQHA